MAKISNTDKRAGRNRFVFSKLTFSWTLKILNAKKNTSARSVAIWKPLARSLVATFSAQTVTKTFQKGFKVLGYNLSGLVNVFFSRRCYKIFVLP